MTSLLPTKFYPPPIPTGYVARPQLLEILDEALAHRLTLVSAPAGAGKTTLVSAWVQSDQKKGAAFGWLSLDNADNDPERFMDYLVACLEEGGTIIDTTALPPRDGEQNQGLKKIIEVLIRGLLDLKREMVLILDDYHLIHNNEVHTAIEYLLEHAPPRLHLILSTRSDPPLELARWRVSGQLVELRMDHLRFTAPEAGVFLKKSAGVQLTESDINALNKRAEGWIAGLQMAAISLRGRENVSAFVAAFAGSHRFVFDYLLEQVLSHQTDEVREFLLQTSILERLSAPLCDAVIESGGISRRLLDELERANLFLVPLDEERIWFRYHHLFADLLHLMLEQTHPGFSAALHRRACRWFETQGLLPEALHHALAAGDMELAAHLVSANVLALVEHAELTPILLRMDTAPREQRASLPWLGVAHAWALAYTGQMEQAETALSQSEKQQDSLSGDERTRMMAHIAAVRAYAAWVHGSQQAAQDFAEEADRLLPAEEVAVRALNLTTLGNALTQYGANPRAVEVLEKAVSLAQEAGQSHVLMPAATALAYAFISMGKLHQAHTICMQAISVADAYQQNNRLPLPAAASAYALLSTILYEWGEAERSIQVAHKGLALSEMWGQTDTTLLCLISLANGLSLSHEAEPARKLLQRARKIALKVSPWFVFNVDFTDLKTCLGMGDIDQAIHLAEEIGPSLPVSVKARLLAEQNHLDEALALIQAALPKAIQTPSLDAVRLNVLQAVVFFHKRNEAQALSALKQAIQLAEPENRAAPFMGKGAAMEKMLRLILPGSNKPKFVRRLLETYKTQSAPTTTAPVELLIEPLSERELEVLQHLNGPLSTPEIAQLLVVSANTARTHIKNIYGKLGVHGRSEAVRRARELNLLT